MPETSPFLPLLKTYFGYDSFRPFQEEIMTRIIQKKDTLALLPTGGGKSLCYQIPALIFPGLTIVISPLISLMKDQVQQLDQVGIPAVYLNSSLSAEAYRQQSDKVRRMEVKLVYAAPETLLTPRFLELVSGLRVDCLTIDEAHCISEWGHDFRPEYRRVAEVRSYFPQAVILALTATATARVRLDIKNALGLSQVQEFVAGFDRPNLHLAVAPKIEGRKQLLEFVERFPSQGGIIYCASRKQVEDVAAFLLQKGHRVRPYHAGLPDATRQENQELFLKDDIDIVVATVAFGMGINKSNVRYVCHYDLPKSLENYYQEIGRAGRDGVDSHCLLLYSYGDAKKQEFFFKDKFGPELEAAQIQLKRMISFSEHEGCRRTPLLGYFGENYLPSQEEGGCQRCDNCKKPPQPPVDLTVPVQKFLSCVLRTGERFGATYVTQVLLGANLETILQRGHNTLSTFGIGSEWTGDQWQKLAVLLQSRGFLLRDEFQGLSLSPVAKNFLKNRETFQGPAPAPRPAPAGKKKKTTGGKLLPGQDKPEGGLFDHLRKLRKQLADGAGIAPFMVFSDKTLFDMVERHPRTTASFLEVFGVGQRKAESYGEAFLASIREYDSQ